jgi:hypothetical protein
MLYELGSHKLIPVGYLHVIIEGEPGWRSLDFKPAFHALQWHLAVLVKGTLLKKMYFAQFDPEYESDTGDV